MDTVYLFDRVFCTEKLLFFNPEAVQSLGAVDKRHNSVPTSYVEALLGIRDMPEGTLRLLASSIGLDLGHWPSTLQGAQFRILVGALRRAVILQVTSPRAAVCRQRSISVANLFQGNPGSLRWILWSNRRRRASSDSFLPRDGDLYSDGFPAPVSDDLTGRCRVACELLHGIELDEDDSDVDDEEAARMLSTLDSSGVDEEDTHDAGRQRKKREAPDYANEIEKTTA